MKVISAWLSLLVACLSSQTSVAVQVGGGLVMQIPNGNTTGMGNVEAAPDGTQLRVEESEEMVDLPATAIAELEIGDTVLVTCAGDVGGDYTTVNFIDSANNVVFHWDPRVQNQQVIRNAKFGYWGTEERTGGWPYPASSSTYTMLFLYTASAWKMTFRLGSTDDYLADFDFAHRSTASIVKIEAGTCSSASYEIVKAPTPSPTASPTASPTTASPTASPTGSPTTASPTASPTESPTTASPTASPTGSPTTASPTASPTAAAPPTSFGDPHISNLRGERFDILSPGDFVYLSIPRAAAGTAAGRQEAAGNGTLLRIVAKVEPLGRLCQEGLLFVTGLELSGQWVLGGRVQSLGLSTSVTAKMEAQALKIKLLQEEQEVPPATANSGSGRSHGSVVVRDLSASELAAEFGPSAGLLEVTDYEPKTLPGAINQKMTVLLLKLKLGPTIAKVRMVQQREKDDKAGEAEGEKKEEQATKGRPRFSNSLWLTVTGLEGVLKGGAADVGGILGFDDHRAATQPPEQCRETLRLPPQFIERSSGGNIHAMITLGDGTPADDDLS